MSDEGDGSMMESKSDTFAAEHKPEVKAISELEKEMEAELGKALDAEVDAQLKDDSHADSVQQGGHRYSSILINKIRYDSYCDESVKASIKVHLKGAAITIFSLGIAYPWALCEKYQAQCHHKVICGRRMKFIGRPQELFKHWLFWWFLTIITIGFYSLVVHIRMDQWVTANTVFEDTEPVDEQEAQEALRTIIMNKKAAKKQQRDGAR